MAFSPLKPNDPRVTYKKDGRPCRTYNIMIAEPEGRPIATMLLIHGFPDLSFGWRYQVPYFQKLGFRVIVPDMLGYGGSDAPSNPEQYTMRKITEDLVQICVNLGVQKVILGGHDWGGALVWRVAMWCPEFVQGVFSICTPFNPPQTTYVDLEEIINKGHLLNFGYQLQFRSPQVEAWIMGRERVRQFLNAMFGGMGMLGELGFSTRHGIQMDVLPGLKKTRLLSEEQLDYYADQYCRNGAPEMRGPLNWYRTRKLNFDDELGLARQAQGQDRPWYKMPALFVAATEDKALPPSMAAGMDKHFASLTRGEVRASHWALTQAPEEVNGLIARWINEKVLHGALKAQL